MYKFYIVNVHDIKEKLIDNQAKAYVRPTMPYLYHVQPPQNRGVDVGETNANTQKPWMNIFKSSITIKTTTYMNTAIKNHKISVRLPNNTNK